MKYFLYFAYGSNLLTKRIHLNNPSAQKLDVAKLEGYQLTFNNYSERWKGAVANILEKEGSFVYGVVWKLNEEDKINLDKQEGVHKGEYHAIEVQVQTIKGDALTARSYELVKKEDSMQEPSNVYMNVILKGAKEQNLPQDYIAFLETIKHNGYNGPVDVNLSFLEI